MADNIVRGFGPLLGQLEDGQLIVDLGESLADLNKKLARVSDAQGKATGKLVLELALSAENGTVEIKSTIKVTDPKTARLKSILWQTKDGHFSSGNPKQTKLPLRDVGGGKGEARDVGDETREERSV